MLSDSRQPASQKASPVFLLAKEEHAYLADCHLTQYPSLSTRVGFQIEAEIATTNEGRSRWWLKVKSPLFKRDGRGCSLVAQRVKDSVLSLLWHWFDPWPRTFHKSQIQAKKKQAKKKDKRDTTFFHIFNYHYCTNTAYALYTYILNLIFNFSAIQIHNILSSWEYKEHNIEEDWENRFPVVSR